jgi:hypothetical protein
MPRKIYDNAQECAQDTPTENLLSLYLKERDRENWSDASTIEQEMHNRGYRIQGQFGNYSLEKKGS